MWKHRSGDPDHDLYATADSVEEQRRRLAHACFPHQKEVAALLVQAADDFIAALPQ